jgi:uncharacterized metal-binding protein YceD (DUF177 family)
MGGPLFKNGTPMRGHPFFHGFPRKDRQMADAPDPTVHPTAHPTAHPTRFHYAPDAEARAALAAELGLLALPALLFAGEIAPAGRDEMVLTGKLDARADQACIVSLAPVRANLSEAVRRRFVADLTLPDGDEQEMPEDDTVEPMPEIIDIAEIAAEALMLALPLYPRASGAELGQLVHAADGVTPLADSDLKPFAGLAGLAGKLSGPAGPKDDPTE